MRFSIAGLVLVSALTSVGPLAASAAAGCSSDAFAIKGAALQVELCAPPHPAGKAAIVIAETLTVKGQPPLARRIVLDAALADEVSRTIDDAPLQALGIAGTLHMTVSYKGGTVHLEHALLVPGAIPLK